MKRSLYTRWPRRWWREAECFVYGLVIGAALLALILAWMVRP